MTWFSLGLVNVLIVFVGWFLIWLDENLVDLANPPLVAGLVVAVVGVLTFFMTLHLAVLDKMRNAIAASFVSAYLVLLAFILFGYLEVTDGDGAPATEEVLKTFTAMVTAIVAFYFAAQAALRINERIQARRERVAGAEFGRGEVGRLEESASAEA
jgi:hypothetical protein